MKAGRREMLGRDLRLGKLGTGKGARASVAKGSFFFGRLGCGRCGLSLKCFELCRGESQANFLIIEAETLCIPGRVDTVMLFIRSIDHWIAQTMTNQSPTTPSLFLPVIQYGAKSKWVRL